MNLKALQHIIRAAGALAEDRGFALEPHDLAAVKLLVGRPKDLNLVEILASRKLIDPKTLRSRIECLDVPLEQRPRLQANYGNIFH